MISFLPAIDPLLSLSPTFKPWDNLARDLPKLLVSDHLRSTLEQMPLFPHEKLTSDQEYERAMLIFSYFAHAYVWSGFYQPIDRLPATIAVPWFQIAKFLARPPVLSYASYALNNWRRLNPDLGIQLGNIALVQNFLGGIDEEWFVLVHIEIEAHAIPGLSAILPAQLAAKNKSFESLLQNLMVMASSLKNMCATLNRMPEHCDPYIYYHRVRPYIHGWENNPALPDGMIYSGVEEYAGKPVKFKGETGAQSSIIPALDCALGIEHQENPLKTHLLDMQNYMPPQHRKFLAEIAIGASIRQAVIDYHDQYPQLRLCYNECLQLLYDFRVTHLSYAAQYIQKQSQTSTGNPTDIGTGGTPFMLYLRQHKDEINQFLL